MTHGLVVVDKPSGMTSHAVVATARRRLGTRAIGHAGTLDPMATGVLLLLVGQATKLSSYLTLESKAYRTEIRFGRATDTLDAEGTTVAEMPVPADALTRERVEAALAAERLRTEQVPPAVSAIQIGGERAHRLTRRGTPPELPARPVRVESITLLELGADRLAVELQVGKGYYVRSFARDLGERLAVPAHVAALRRIRSGAFTLAEAVAWPLPDALQLVPVAEAARRCLPCAVLTADGEKRARLGQPVTAAGFVAEPQSAEPFAWLTPAGELVAIGSKRDGAHQVLRGFPPLPAPGAHTEALD